MEFASLRRLGAVAISCVMSLFLALPAVAGAGTSEYAPEPEARSFASSSGGWTSSSSFTGSCVPPLLCPTVTNAFQPTGGADGNGFIRSGFTGVAGGLGVAGTATGVWESPEFAYRGAAGEPPTSVSFTLARQASVEQLLAVPGNSAEYAVELVDLNSGSASVPLIGQTTLAGAPAWTNVPAAPVSPARLKIGDRYKIRITSIYKSGTSVLVTGNADYDDVVLKASTAGNGSGGAGGGVAGTLTDARLQILIRGALGSTAVLKGNRIFVKVRCRAKIGRPCRTVLQGLLKKRKPATSRAKTRIAKGKSKRVVLRIKPKARPKVAKRKRLLFRLDVRAGGAKATVYKRLKLIRRR